jgi:hypothetical protein
METALHVIRKSAILAASGRFGKFRPETGHDVRRNTVEGNPAIEAMKVARSGFGDFMYQAPEDNYAGMLERIRNLDYSAKDIEAFCIVLPVFEHEGAFSSNAGVFLSALINNCRDSEFMIHTGQLVKPINYIGYRNTKNIIIDGNAGRELGFEMEGGTITVNGNAAHHVGFGMRGGIITVNGNADSWIGEEMKGGEIRIVGDCSELSSCILGGRILHKGEQIFPK